MFLKKYILLLFIILLNYSAETYNNDEYLKINKSFEIFGSVFNEITTNYVTDVDSEELIARALEAMLNSLDPYSIYINKENEEDIDIVSTGSYVGIGINVADIDSSLTITDISPESPAKSSGLRIGDRILKVDSTNVLKLDPEQLRLYTKGKPGSNVKLTVLRSYSNDTLSFDLKRNEINLKNVTFSGLINDNTGYIKLERFSKLTESEVRSALLNMINKDKISSLVIDLRGNPGGLLNAALDVCELFVPENSVLVTTRGKYPGEVIEYKSQSKPIAPDIKLALLIDGGSASASEIIAGAMQDLDRGIIVGTKSFGKGLVQTIVPLPYDNALKLTTSKYYTPSGRCIQKMNYSSLKRKNGLNLHYDSLYHTKNNRTVFESDGIVPDSVVNYDTIPEIIKFYYSNNSLFKFSNQFIYKKNEIPENFELSDNDFYLFKEFLKKYNLLYSSSLDRNIDTILLVAKKEKISTKSINDLDKSLNRLRGLFPDSFDIYKNEIKEALEKEILRRFYDDKFLLAKYIQKDKMLNVTLNLLENENYNRILKTQN